MNVKLKVLTAGVLFFTGQALSAQEAKTSSKKDSASTKEIQEVVILGYGKTSSKAKSTTSSVTISSDAFENRPTTSFLNSVQGSAPGVSINSQSGSPGSGRIDIKVRGLSSLNASTEPVYVIDGMISTGTEYRNLNPNDIETLSILKDAQATAIYGNYGASGVVVITTKSGRFNSGLKVSYDVVTSFSTLPKHKYNTMSAQELLLTQYRYGQELLAKNPNLRLNANSHGIGSLMSLEEIENYGINTDWRKVLFRTAFSQNHNLGFRYGGQNFAGFTSLGYLESEGNVRNTDFKRFTFRTNIRGNSANKKLSYTTQIALGHSRRYQLDAETNSDISNNIVQNPLLGIVRGAPFWAPYNGNGRELYNELGFGALNRGRGILVLHDVIKGGVVGKYSQTSVNVNGSLTYKFTKDLSITNKTGVNYKNNYYDLARDPNGFLASAVAGQNGIEYGGWEVFSNQHDVIFNSITSLAYDKKFGEHSLNLGAYIDYLRGFYNATQQTQNGLNPLNWAFGAGTGYIPFNPSTPDRYVPSVSASKVKAGTLAYIGTLDYDYASKYGVSATIRRDGSYRFDDANKWETFWSVGARWNIDKEVFMENSIFDLLKLRASYGTNGNQNLGISSINTNPLFLASNLVRDTYSTNTGYENLAGYSTTIRNAEARWEKVSQANIGLDFALFGKKIEGAVDVYNKKTSDMYLSVPISAVNGVYAILGNNGEMRNRGIEASLRYTPIKNENLRLSVFANLGYNKNKIMAMPSEDLSSSLVNSIGGSAYQWQLYNYVGVNPRNGNYLFLDRNNNLTENPTAADRKLTGKSAYAPYNGGFGLDIDYKGFFLTSLFSYQAGGWALDAMDYWMHLPSNVGSGSNVSRDLLYNAWTPTNTNTDVAALSASNASLLSSSDKFLRKTDYIRLKSISLGYNVSKDLLRNLPVKALKVYVSGENLVTWTGWKGFDPETALGTSVGVYPNAKTYSVGVNLEF